MATDIAPGQSQLGEIIQAEINAINARRRHLGRQELVLGPDAGSGKTLEAVGLALSGGGVRSAAFSLGILQALNRHNVLRNIDYISTVSAGGYMGSSLTTTMTCTRGEFVFGSPPKREASVEASDISDTAAVGHLRNYSNYLIPAGARDVVTGLAVIIRGLVANMAWVMGPVLFLAAITILINPSYEDLGCADLLGYPLCKKLPLLGSFGLTMSLGLLGLLLFFAWALYRSFSPPDRLAEFRTRLPMLASMYLGAIAVAFFIELQPYFLKGIFDLNSTSPDWPAKILTSLATVLAPLAA